MTCPWCSVTVREGVFDALSRVYGGGRIPGDELGKALEHEIEQVQSERRTPAWLAAYAGPLVLSAILAVTGSSPEDYVEAAAHMLACHTKHDVEG